MNMTTTKNANKEAAIQRENEVQNHNYSTQLEPEQPRVVRPVADIHETKEGATVLVDLPGVNHKSLDVNVDNDVLTIEGHVDLQTPDDLNPTFMDVRAGKFSRKFTLSAELDSSKIDAHLKDGVLKLVIPRSEKHKPRKVEVKAA